MSVAASEPSLTLTRHQSSSRNAQAGVTLSFTPSWNLIGQQQDKRAYVAKIVTFRADLYPVAIYVFLQEPMGNTLLIARNF